MSKKPPSGPPAGAPRKRGRPPREGPKPKRPPRNNAVANPPARIGRPDLLTPQVHAEIVMALEAGNYLHVAAAAAGIHSDTLNHWMHRGAADERKRKKGEPESKFEIFSAAVKKAMARGETMLVATMSKAAKGGQWQAAARMLEAKEPARWARKQRVELTGGGEGTDPVKLLVYIPKLSDE